LHDLEAGRRQRFERPLSLEARDGLSERVEPAEALLYTVKSPPICRRNSPWLEGTG